jgi:hypothetical protein
MSESVRFAKGLLLATIPERRQEAMDLCQSLLDESEPTDPNFPPEIQILCLLGEQEMVISKARKRQAALGNSKVANWMPEKSLRFHAGATIDDFKADCGETPIGRLEYDYHVAMRKLSERDREGALRHFAECAKSSLIDSGYRKWALAFRRLLADNPDWPTKKNLQDR